MICAESLKIINSMRTARNGDKNPDPDPTEREKIYDLRAPISFFQTSVRVSLGFVLRK